MKSKEEIDYWVFSSYKNENDYENNQPFFEEEFTDFNKMKTFSANHSHINKKVYPNYCSNYKKIEPIHKLNNGNGATLCNLCGVIISVGFTNDLFCEKHNQKTNKQDNEK